MAVSDSHADMTFTSMRKVKPNNGWVLCQRQEPPTMTEHGIHLLSKDASEQRFELAKATVLAVGGPTQDDKGNYTPSTLSAGQIVMVPRFCGHDAQFSDGPALFVKELEVLGVCEA